MIRHVGIERDEHGRPVRSLTVDEGPGAPRSNQVGGELVTPAPSEAERQRQSVREAMRRKRAGEPDRRLLRPRCGLPMRGGQTCGRLPGHGDWCRSSSAIADARARSRTP